MASIIVDDQDASVTYSGSWLRYGGKFEYDSTTSLAISPGLQASLRFTGISVAVFGTLSATTGVNAPITSYQIDGKAMGTFSPGIPSTDTYRQQFFRADNLSPGPHTLVVSSVSDRSYIYLDYFEVVPVPTSNPAPAPIPTPSVTPSGTPNQVTSSTSLSQTSSGSITAGKFTGSSTTSNSQTTNAAVGSLSTAPSNITSSSNIAGPSDTTIPPAPNSQSSTTSKTLSGGAIAGAAIGGTLVAILFVLGILLCLKRRKRTQGQDQVYDVAPVRDPEMQDLNDPNPIPVVRPYTVLQPLRHPDLSKEAEMQAYEAQMSDFTSPPPSYTPSRLTVS